MSIRYRPEIDGLRAIAVSGVVMYHAGIGGAGFVGVDVFFVISGYLITSLLLREEAEGRIDLLAFYARRVRRIFPAAFLVTAFTVLLAPIFLGPEAVLQTARAAVASAFFAANFYFQANTGGYFTPAVEQMPLLHLWSLAVEEQFYLLWPALLIWLPRRYLVHWLIALGIGSFWLSEILIANNLQSAFYQMPARFWELALGGIVAALPARSVPRFVLPAGLLCLLLAFGLESGHFPGFGALPTVLSTCLIVLAIHSGATSRVLSSRILVALGLWSYSLYLWHWPLLAFYSASTVGGGELLVRIFICYLAVALAALTYRYVEQPFRRIKWPSQKLVVSGVGCSIALAISALAFSHTVDLPQPHEGDEQLAYKIARDSNEKRADQPNARVVVWGDSYAKTWQALAWDIGRREKIGAKTITLDGCPPLLGFKIKSHEHEACKLHNSKVVESISGMDTIVLAFYWQRYVGESDPARVESALRSTIQELSAVRRVLIIAPTPVMRDELPKCIRIAEDCGVSRVSFEMSTLPVQAILERVTKDFPNVGVVDATDYLCTATRCPGFRGGMALYTDQSHLTASASTAAVAWLAR